tara:strand:+ start:604 stop:1035 length:432 start_codon:yes stop_codon:yes gene_type:complete
MIILTTSEVSQAISVIPRDYFSEFTMSIRDDSTNVTKLYPINTATQVGNYLNFNNIFDPKLVKNHFFDLRLFVNFNFWNTNFNFWQLDNQLWNKDDGEVKDIYRDRIFCTDQDINQLQNNRFYQLNEGQYVEYNGFDNTYIVP